MKRPIIIILSVIAVFILLGTSVMYLFGLRLGYGGGASIEAPAPEVGFAPAATEAPAAAEAPMPAVDGFSPGDAARQSVINSVQAQERIVIENADLAIVVKDPAARMKEISELAKKMGGFVVSSNLYQSYYGPNKQEVPEASIVIRVPSEKLDEALAKIKEGAVDIQS